MAVTIMDGPFIEVVSSTSGKTYQVFALGTEKQWCTCPAYKFQKLPVAQRNCKHTLALLKSGAKLPLSVYAK